MCPLLHHQEHLDIEDGHPFALVYDRLCLDGALLAALVLQGGGNNINISISSTTTTIIANLFGGETRGLDLALSVGNLLPILGLLHPIDAHQPVLGCVRLLQMFETNVFIANLHLSGAIEAGR